MLSPKQPARSRTARSWYQLNHTKASGEPWGEGGQFFGSTVDCRAGKRRRIQARDTDFGGFTKQAERAEQSIRKWRATILTVSEISPSADLFSSFKNAKTYRAP